MTYAIKNDIQVKSMSNSYHGWRTDLILVRYKDIHIPYRSLKLKLREQRKQGINIQPKDELTKYNLTNMRKMMREVLNYRGIFDIKAVLREPANLVWSCQVPIKEQNK